MRFFKYALLVFSAVAFQACDSSVKQSKVEAEASKIIVAETLELSGEQRFEDVDMSGDVVINEKQYHYEINRKSSDDLPLVKGDFSTKAQFHDNKVTLKITSGDRNVFSQTYTKNDFSNFVDADMLKHSVLRGFVFMEELENGLEFAIAVGYPQDDEMYVPILLKVKTDGSASLEKDPMMDSSDIPSGEDPSMEEGV